MTASRRRYMRLALAAASGLALAIGTVARVEDIGRSFLSDRSSNGESGPATAAVPSTEPGGESAVMSLHNTPRLVPEFRFEVGNGKPVTLVDFPGKVVLLNIWALAQWIVVPLAALWWAPRPVMGNQRQNEPYA